MNLETIVAALPALRKLESADVSIRTAYKINKLMKSIRDEVGFFESSREKIVKAHGTDEGNGAWKIRAEDMAQYQKEMLELLCSEVDVDVKKAAISLEENVSLSAADVDLISEFVEFEEGD